jgi:hypothetical protein
MPWMCEQPGSAAAGGQAHMGVAAQQFLLLFSRLHCIWSPCRWEQARWDQSFLGSCSLLSCHWRAGAFWMRCGAWHEGGHCCTQGGRPGRDRILCVLGFCCGAGNAHCVGEEQSAGPVRPTSILFLRSCFFRLLLAALLLMRFWNSWQQLLSALTGSWVCNCWETL